MTITDMSSEHWPAVKAIYEEGIQTGQATFETTAPSWESWDAGHRKDCRFVAMDEGVVRGWAALSPVSGRCVYAGVVEVSVYVSEASRGMGIGRQLLQQLIKESEKRGLWTLQAGIFPENMASLRLHQHCGFKIVGVRERIGKMQGVWRNTVLLERRSDKIGVDD